MHIGADGRECWERCGEEAFPLTSSIPLDAQTYLAPARAHGTLGVSRSVIASPGFLTNDAPEAPDRTQAGRHQWPASLRWGGAVSGGCRPHAGRPTPFAGGGTGPAFICLPQVPSTRRRLPVQGCDSRSPIQQTAPIRSNSTSPPCLLQTRPSTTKKTTPRRKTQTLPSTMRLPTTRPRQTTTTTMRPAPRANPFPLAGNALRPTPRQRMQDLRIRATRPS